MCNLYSMRERFSLWFLFASLHLIEGEATAGCPCIDPWSNANLSAVSYYNAADNCLITADGDCAPITFGASVCASYSVEFQNCDEYSRSVEDYNICANEWCYVVHTSCIYKYQRVLQYSQLLRNMIAVHSYHLYGLFKHIYIYNMYIWFSGPERLHQPPLSSSSLPDARER